MSIEVSFLSKGSFTNFTFVGFVSGMYSVMYFKFSLAVKRFSTSVAQVPNMWPRARISMEHYFRSSTAISAWK